MRHLHGCRPSQVVGLADDEVVEGEGRKETGFFVITLASTRFFLGTTLPFDRGAGFGRYGLDRCRVGLDTGRRRLAATNDQGNGDRTGKKIAAVVLDARKIAVTNPFQDEAIGCDQAQPIFKRRGFAFQAQRLDPGVELLRGQFLLEALQTGFPETGHRRKHSSPRSRYKARWRLLDI